MSNWTPLCICGHPPEYHTDKGCTKCKCGQFVRTDVAIARTLNVMLQVMMSPPMEVHPEPEPEPDRPSLVDILRNPGGKP